MGRRFTVFPKHFCKPFHARRDAVKRVAKYLVLILKQSAALFTAPPVSGRGAGLTRHRRSGNQRIGRTLRVLQGSAVSSTLRNAARSSGAEGGSLPQQNIAPSSSMGLWSAKSVSLRPAHLHQSATWASRNAEGLYCAVLMAPSGLVSHRTWGRFPVVIVSLFRGP